MAKFDVEKKITIIIPSKIVDDNLKYCIKKIRNFYKKIRIIIILDIAAKIKFDKNTNIVVSNSKTIGFKRNLGPYLWPLVPQSLIKWLLLGVDILAWRWVLYGQD